MSNEELFEKNKVTIENNFKLERHCEICANTFEIPCIDYPSCICPDCRRKLNTLLTNQKLTCKIFRNLLNIE